MNHKREFQALYGRLGLPAVEVAAIVGRSVSAVRGYLSEGRASRNPDGDVLVALRKAWRQKAQLQLTELVEHLRDEGVSINWDSVEEYGPVERVFVRPAFLGR